VISVQNVTMAYPVPKRYREYLVHPLRPPRRIVALESLSLDVATGRCAALLGPNGVGKTTLLKLIGGLLYPSKGRVRVAGIDTTSHNLHARMRVGFVINDDRSFYWRLTGAENLEFFGALDNLQGVALRQRVAGLLEQVGLGQAGGRRVSDYSSGMRQRLAIARGLLADPEVLLLDEPTRSLDPLGADAIRELIAEEIHRERRRTMVLATNELGDVSALCDEVSVLRGGRITGAMRVDGAAETEIARFYRAHMQAPA